ncbi:MAG: methyltransferase [Oscillospiraceae bacterium]|nr:methyltransferase [Oscillospiraceae bacterium]
MTHRERFHSVARREPADRVVFDLCGSPQTGIDYPQTREALAAHLGVFGPKQGPWLIDERILEHFDIDTRLVGGMPTPETVHCRLEGDVRYNAYGIGYTMINGHYEICSNPLKGCTLDEMLRYPMPEAAHVDRGRVRAWAEDARLLHERTDYAVVAEHPVLGVFEIGCWMHGFDDYLYRLAAEPEYVHAFSGRILDYQKAVIDIYYGALGSYIDCTTSGDDFGMQTGPFMSAEMFGELIAPYLKERISYTKRHTDAVYKHHTCGSVHAFIPQLIECGVDILNPIQPGTYMMEPERLKADFGGGIAFWGGIDTQHLLPEGSVEDVKGEVKRILAIMERSGENKKSRTGYILAPAHCIQPDVPPQNIAAIYEGAKEYYANVTPTYN